MASLFNACSDRNFDLLNLSVSVKGNVIIGDHNQVSIHLHCPTVQGAVLRIDQHVTLTHEAQSGDSPERAGRLKGEAGFVVEPKDRAGRLLGPLASPATDSPEELSLPISGLHPRLAELDRRWEAGFQQEAESKRRMSSVFRDRSGGDGIASIMPQVNLTACRLAAAAWAIAWLTYVRGLCIRYIDRMFIGLSNALRRAIEASQNAARKVPNQPKFAKSKFPDTHRAILPIYQANTLLPDPPLLFANPMSPPTQFIRQWP